MGFGGWKVSRSSEATLCSHQYPGTAVVNYIL